MPVQGVVIALHISCALEGGIADRQTTQQLPQLDKQRTLHDQKALPAEVVICLRRVRQVTVDRNDGMESFQSVVMHTNMSVVMLE